MSHIWATICVAKVFVSCRYYKIDKIEIDLIEEPSISLLLKNIVS